MGEASTARSILNFFTMQRVVQRLATVLYELKCIQQGAKSDSAERFHLVHYKVQCLIVSYLFLITFLFIYLFIYSRNFMLCTPHQISFELSNQEGDGRGM
jgi:hypothetical protein